MTLLRARRDPPPCAHDRLTFGCAGCARKRDEAVAQAELDATPVRKVQLQWKVEQTGVLDVETKLPRLWSHEQCVDHLSMLFDDKIGASDAMTQILCAIRFDGWSVGEVVESASPPDPAQAAFDLGGAQ